MQVIKGQVSVVIPLYNREEYIVEAIESVLKQSYENVQLIIVDDGSTDGSRELVEGYKRQLMILEHSGRVNKGQSAAINLGMAHASGEYIFILDSDDYIERSKLAKQVEFLEKNPLIGLVYSNGYAVSSEGEPLYEIYKSEHAESNLRGSLLLDCYILLPNNSLVRRSIYDQVGGFDENLRAAQDHDMIVRISEVTAFAYINQHLFFYRRHENSISSNGATQRWINGFVILNKAKKRYPYKKNIVRKRKAVLYFRLFQCYWKERLIIPALKSFILAGWFDPLRSFGVIFGNEKAGGPS